MVAARRARHAAVMDGPLPRRDRPVLMRIDPARCLHGGACRLLAPEIVDPERIEVTAATLDAMAACPSGALTWREDLPSDGS